MNLQKVCVMVALVSAPMASAMEGGKVCLRALATAETARIGLTNPLDGEPNMQRLAVKNLMAKLPEVVIGDTEGNFDVDMTALRKVLVDTARELPQPKGQTPDLTQLNLEALEAQGERLVRNVSRLGIWGKRLAVGGTIFVAGMIVGWFYTTKAHHAATHH